MMKVISLICNIICPLNDLNQNFEKGKVVRRIIVKVGSNLTDQRKSTLPIMRVFIDLWTTASLRETIVNWDNHWKKEYDYDNNTSFGRCIPLSSSSTQKVGRCQWSGLLLPSWRIILGDVHTVLVAYLQNWPKGIVHCFDKWTWVPLFWKGKLGKMKARNGMKYVIWKLKNKFSVSIRPLPSLNFVSCEKLLKINWLSCCSFIRSITYSLMCWVTHPFNWVFAILWLFFIIMITTWAANMKILFSVRSIDMQWKKLGILLQLQIFRWGRIIWRYKCYFYTHFIHASVRS